MGNILDGNELVAAYIDRSGRIAFRNDEGFTIHWRDQYYLSFSFFKGVMLLKEHGGMFLRWAGGSNCYKATAGYSHEEAFFLDKQPITYSFVTDVPAMIGAILSPITVPYPKSFPEELYNDMVHFLQDDLRLPIRGWSDVD